MKFMSPEDKVIKILVVRTDGTTTIDSCPASHMWDKMRQWIGCEFVEPIHFSLGTIYIDEDGKSKSMDINWLVTKFCHEQGRIMADDFIVGPAVFAGPADSEGYDTGIDLGELQKVFPVTCA